MLIQIKKYPKHVILEYPVIPRLRDAKIRDQKSINYQKVLITNVLLTI